jgi:hypothetical protein
MIQHKADLYTSPGSSQGEPRVGYKNFVFLSISYFFKISGNVINFIAKKKHGGKKKHQNKSPGFL